MPERIENLLKQIPKSAAYAAVFFLCIVPTVAPFVLFGSHPLGYDTGFYMRYLSQERFSIPNTAVPGLDHTVLVPRILLDGTIRLVPSPDIALYVTLAVLFVVTVIVFVYFMYVSTDFSSVVFGGLLLSQSPVLYLAYHHVFFKNFLGLIFLALALILFERKSYAGAFFASLLIVPTHQSTTILTILVLGCYVCIKFLRNKPIHAEITTLGAVMGTYVYLHPNVSAKFAAPPVGVFLDMSFYWILMLPVLILLALRWRSTLNLLWNHDAALALAVTSVLFLVLRIPYYERIALVASIVLTTLVGIALKELYAQRGIHRVVAILCITLQVGLLSYLVYSTKPLLPRDFVSVVESLNDVIPDNATVITMPHLAPWVHGWTKAQVYAPGMFKDGADPGSWNHYFTHSDVEYDALFLARYTLPLYFVTDEASFPLLIPPLPCVTKVTNVVFRYDCEYL